MTRFEDLVIEAPGVSVKGMVEVDGSCEVQSASFPVFNLSDGEAASTDQGLAEGRSRTGRHAAGDGARRRL